MSPRRCVCNEKIKEPRTETSGTPDNNEHQIKYYETETLWVEIIQVLYMTDQTCLST